jgi:RND family efflux transporter MFP subunit
MLKLKLSSSVILLSFFAAPAHGADYDTALNAETQVQTRQTRGVLQAGQTAEIAAGMTGRLLKANYKPGQFFKSGALLARFDCTRQNAERLAIEQAHKTLMAKHENVSELYALGAAGELEVTIARSEMQQAAAERDAIDAKLKDCSIYAPYAGHVTERHVSAFETPQIGQPLYSIQRYNTLELSIIAPSKWMRWLKVGQKLDFTVDETGEVFKAKIIRTGVSVDPVSQTVELTAKPTGKTKSLAGMSGVADFGPKQ